MRPASISAAAAAPRARPPRRGRRGSGSEHAPRAPAAAAAAVLRGSAVRAPALERAQWRRREGGAERRCRQAKPCGIAPICVSCLLRELRLRRRVVQGLRTRPNTNWTLMIQQHFPNGGTPCLSAWLSPLAEAVTVKAATLDVGLPSGPGLSETVETAGRPFPRPTAVPVGTHCRPPAGRDRLSPGASALAPRYPRAGPPRPGRVERAVRQGRRWRLLTTRLPLRWRLLTTRLPQSSSGGRVCDDSPCCLRAACCVAAERAAARRLHRALLRAAARRGEGSRNPKAGSQRCRCCAA
jgi:hypothetical protein